MHYGRGGWAHAWCDVAVALSSLETGVEIGRSKKVMGGWVPRMGDHGGWARRLGK